jgi:membrane protein
LLPEAELSWRDALVGAVLTGLLFLAGRFAIGFYLGTSAPASTFGAASSLAVLLLWVYYSASIFFLGAEATRLFIARDGADRRRQRASAGIAARGRVPPRPTPRY